MRGLKIIIRGMALLIALYAMAAGGIAWDGLNDEIAASDVGVVLGNEVRSDGTPSERLKGRLDKAVELYSSGLLANIVVSGGRGKSGYDEAAVMRNYLLQHGVPSKTVLVDSAGVNTFHTAKNSARLMASHGWRSALVISQYFHISRSRLAMKRFGIDKVYSAHADYYEPRDIYSLGREVVAYAYYLVRRYPD